jgi:hypothetical protein
MFVIGAPESYVPSADEVQLSNLVMDYWTRFAAKGDPNRPHAFRWPRYTADDLILEAGCDSGAAGGLPQPAMRLYRATPRRFLRTKYLPLISPRASAVKQGVALNRPVRRGHFRNC